ncbi:hypothetical protein AMS59_23175 [Lysinibacillus sp. FJAT-14745]|nr:hypothetical protein AMS59_23175 [Lysinibacillus sp. FJAT-14745]
MCESVATAKGFYLRESEAAAATARSYEGVITGLDAFSLRSSIADLQRVAEFSLQLTYPHEPTV